LGPAGKGCVVPVPVAGDIVVAVVAAVAVAVDSVVAVAVVDIAPPLC
jgi:hypothetical protein